MAWKACALSVPLPFLNISYVCKMCACRHFAIWWRILKGSKKRFCTHIEQYKHKTGAEATVVCSSSTYIPLCCWSGASTDAASHQKYGTGVGGWAVFSPCIFIRSPCWSLLLDFSLPSLKSLPFTICCCIVVREADSSCQQSSVHISHHWWICYVSFRFFSFLHEWVFYINKQ